MKKLKLLFLTLICFIQLHAQDQRSTWGISTLLSHYDREKENELNLGDVGYNINPGLEVLYGYQLRNSFFLSTGISYQYVDLVSHLETYDRFQVGELSIPVLLTVKDESGFFSFSTGFYSGRFLHFSWDKRLHSQWIPVNPKEREQYSDKSFFMDAYLDFAYSNSRWFKDGNVIRIAPFVRFRFKENWMDYYRTSIYYGIKLGIDLNFKLKEK
ncbi:MAG: hypothetical protein Q8R96_19020 [Bacteroidota bacterium]|nr:hypothetical protein [Bacteroidota bacterium]